MNVFKLLFCLFIFVGVSECTSAQRGISATLTLNSVSHAPCFTGIGDVNLQLTVSASFSPYVIGGYTLVLNKDGVYYSTISSTALQSSGTTAIPITGLPTGYYTISGTAILTNPVNMTGYGSASFSNLSYFLGYQAIWNETKEMTVQTVPSTVLQNIASPTQTYAGARALNADIGDMWFIAAPVFNSGNTTARSVYVSLVNTANLVVFNPSSQNNYLEFRKANSTDPNTGDGVYYKSSVGVYKLAGVNYTDKIRVVKFGSALLFFKDQGATSLSSGSATPYIATFSSPVNITTFTKVINDGVNVGTSLRCNSSTDAYAVLFDELDGYYYTVKNGKLRFVFNQHYDTQNNLKFNIYDQKGALIKTQVSYPAVQATYGDNYLTLDLTTTSGCVGLGFFVLEVISDKKEKMYLRFYSEYGGCSLQPETPPGEEN
jgi:hypothetical protein